MRKTASHRGTLGLIPPPKFTKNKKLAVTLRCLRQNRFIARDIFFGGDILSRRKPISEFKKKVVHDSLLQQLTIMGADVGFFVDMLDDYMALWEIKGKLEEDIQNRGVVYTDKSSVGVQMQKNNPSVKEIVMINKQMLSILREMGLSTDKVGSDADDEL